jgi:hypothetical protein
MSTSETKRTPAPTTAKQATDSGDGRAATSKPGAPSKGHQSAVRTASAATRSGPLAM